MDRSIGALTFYKIIATLLRNPKPAKAGGD